MSPDIPALRLRPDLLKIYEVIPPGSRVLDLGAGSGDLLKALERCKGATVFGIDKSTAGIMKCIAKGIPIFQSNLDEGLEDYEDQSFDYVILSPTLPQLQKPKKILQDAVRVGKTALVSIPNFGHWRIRFQLLFRGTMPTTRAIPYRWYETPNIHLLSILDFRDLCAEVGIRIVREHSVGFRRGFLARFRPLWPNMFAAQGVFEIRR